VGPERTHNRREERKFKRIFVRYGRQQISASGFFLSTNETVYANDSPSESSSRRR